MQASAAAHSPALGQVAIVHVLLKSTGEREVGVGSGKGNSSMFALTRRPSLKQARGQVGLPCLPVLAFSHMTHPLLDEQRLTELFDTLHVPTVDQLCDGALQPVWVQPVRSKHTRVVAGCISSA